MAQPESIILREILAAYGSREGLLLWRNAVGVGIAPADGRVLTFGTPGAADILGVCRGHAIAIEVKTPRGRQSPRQKTWQAAFEAAGGTYILARAVDDPALQEILGSPAP